MGTLARFHPGLGSGVLLAACLAAPMARAADPAAPPAGAQPAAAPAGAPPASAAAPLAANAAAPVAPGALPSLPPPGAPQELPLALQEALALAIENNLDVQISRYDPLIAHEDHVAAWGAYDPRAVGEFGYRYDEIPVASALQSNSILLEKEYAGSAGLEGMVPLLGWSYRLDYSGQGLRSTSTIQDLSPEYRAGVRAVVTAPLLKGFLWSEPWVAVKATGIAEGASLDEFRRALMDTIVDTERAYWGLVASEERLRVANKSLETALTLREQTGAQYDVGVVSRVEVVEADAGVASREFDRITSENVYRRSQDRLIDLVLGPNLTPGSRLEIRPTSDPDVVAYDIDAEAATARALENRPEIALAQALVDQEELNLKFARNQRLPQLDAVGSYGYAGLAGVTNPAPGFGGIPRTPVDVDRTYPGTDDEFFSADGARSWTLGGVLSFPLGKITDRANVRRAELTLRRSETELRRVEQAIVLEIRDAVRNLESAQEGIEAAERRRLAAEEQLRAERIRLEHGESTPFDVLQREEDLVDAESQKIAALQVYRDSLAALDRAQGTILRDRNIVVEDARALR
jgi:outer membrane protein TolC